MGSAALFFSLRPERALLNDVNPHLATTFQAIKSTPHLIFEKLKHYPLTKEFYYQLRPRAFKARCSISLSANFLYLNRYCFNGLFRTNRIGEFNVPYSNQRNGSLPTLENLTKASDLLQRAEIFSTDFESFVRINIRPGDFVYMDPPYAVRNVRVFHQYSFDTFGIRDLHRLSNLLDDINAIGASFLLSYADCEEANSQFGKWQNISLITRRNISGFKSGRKMATERIFTNIRKNVPGSK